MSFWTENNFEPKRAFRFKLNLGFGNNEDSIPYFYLKSATKPTFEIAHTTHKVAGREFNFPGSISWKDVTLVMVDDVQNTVIRRFVDIIQNSNYPDVLKGAGSAFTEDGNLQFISKAKATLGLTNSPSNASSVNGTSVFFTIDQLNADGNVVESWNLYNPSITKLEQDGLDYGKEDLSTYTLTVKYDWANLNP